MNSNGKKYQKKNEKESKIDWELVESFKRSIEYLKQGRIKEWKENGYINA